MRLMALEEWQADNLVPRVVDIGLDRDRLFLEFGQSSSICHGR